MPVFYCIPSAGEKQQTRKPFSVTGNGRPELLHDEFRQRNQHRQKNIAEGENGTHLQSPNAAELEAGRGP